MDARISDRSARLLATVRELLPELEQSVESSDRDRRVPPEVIAAIRSAGVYRMLVPLELGGDQLDLQTAVDVIETVSQGSAAAGWDISTSTWEGLVALTLPIEGLQEIYADGPDIAFAGGFAGAGRATPTEGGFDLTGRWKFGSGCMEADWILAGGWQVFYGGDSPRLVNGQPEIRLALVPRADVSIHQNWDVAGLQGTGSHDLELDGALVPESRTQLRGAICPWPGTLYRVPTTTVVNAFFMSAVVTGIARRAIDALVELAQHKTPRSGHVLRDRVQAQEAVARAEALLESARAYRREIVADIWRTVNAKSSISLQQRAQVRLAGVSATEAAVRAVDLMYGAASTAAIQNESPLSHCFRDVHAAAANVNVLPSLYENVGRVYLGLEAGNPLIGS